MRLTNVFGGRPAFYDRNPTTQALGATAILASLAPHSLTTRFVYTVPSARKFLVGLLGNSNNRAAVATTGGSVESRIRVTPNGGSITYMLNNEQFGTVAGTGQEQTGGSGTALLAGDVIAGEDVDTSVGGTVTYIESCLGTEFDA